MREMREGNKVDESGVGQILLIKDIED